MIAVGMPPLSPLFFFCRPSFPSDRLTERHRTALVRQATRFFPFFSPPLPLFPRCFLPTRIVEKIPFSFFGTVPPSSPAYRIFFSFFSAKKGREPPILLSPFFVRP